MRPFESFLRCSGQSDSEFGKPPACQPQMLIIQREINFSKQIYTRVSLQKCSKRSLQTTRNFKLDPRIVTQRSHVKLATKITDEVDLDGDIVASFDGKTRLMKTESSPLLGLNGLDKPKSFVEWAIRTRNGAQSIVEEVCRQDLSIQDQTKIVKRLDRLSDEICAVVDSAEVIRNVHPDLAWCEAADQAHQVLSSYLNHLNTHTGLYNALKNAVNNSEIVENWSVVEKRVADLLLQDFEKSGIHMAPKERGRFVDLHDQILRLGHEFTQKAHSSQAYIDVQGDAWETLQGLRNDLIRGLIRNTPATVELQGKTRIPTSGKIAQTVLSQCRNEQARKQMYIGMNTASEEQLATLENMLRLRSELATLLGKNSYAQVFLADKMASTPEHVLDFLNGMSRENMPRVHEEVARLSKLKQSQGQGSEIYAWDRQFYTRLLPASQQHRDSMEAPHMPLENRVHSASNQEMTIGIAMAGVSRLLQILYGIRLQPVETQLGEVWHRDVTRLDAVHETEGKVGTIYCDLFAREGARKYENAAHFTVQCSRRVDWDRLDVALPVDNLGHAQEVGQFKLPVVVLVTNFARDSKLGWGDVETLFHEMGHAVQSLLARTEFQHISGTRCQMDFVEVPSILMEYLLRHVGVPGHSTPVWDPDPIDVQTQIRLSILDQLYHSELAKGKLDTTELYHRVQSKYDVLPPVYGTAWQAQFGHLYSYGASYYTYLWSRKWASRIFDEIFAGKPLEDMRQGGDLLRRELLSVGGGKDGWEVLENLKVK
jgi:intermediate peptidase